MVTYKKFGREYTVPEEDAPLFPTRATRLTIAKRGRYIKRAAALLRAPPMPVAESPTFVYATKGTPVTERKRALRKREERNAGLRKSGRGGGGGGTEVAAAAAAQ